MKGYLDAIPKDRMSPLAWTAPAAFASLSDHHAVVEAHPRGGGAVLVHWAAGDFILSSTILRTPDKYTLPIGLYNPVAQKWVPATPPTLRGGADRRTGGDPLRRYKNTSSPA